MYRVWDKQNEQFVFKSQFAIFGNGSSISSVIERAENYNDFERVSNDDDYVIQHYTGLNDIVDNPIYEGDIVKNTTSSEEYCSPAVIVWGKYEYVGYALAGNFKNKKPNVLLHTINGINLIEELMLCRFGTYEVIGNIFENKDLLNTYD